MVVYAEKIIDFIQDSWATIVLVGMNGVAPFHKQTTPAIWTGIQKHTEILVVFTVLFAEIEA
jgi:hypothetical protein